MNTYKKASSVECSGSRLEELRFSVEGSPSFDYVIQTSFDLVEWIDLEAINLDDKGKAIKVLPTDKSNYQFFRLRRMSSDL